MKKFLEKLKGMNGKMVGVLLTCVLMGAGVPVHQAVTAGNAAGDIVDTMKGGVREHGEEKAE